jgi:hypothetical protein
MGSLKRSAGLVLLIVLPAVAAPAAAPRAPNPADAPRAADSAAAPDLHRWRLTRHGFGRLKVGLNRTKIERRTGRKLVFSYNTGSCAIWAIRGVRGLSIMTIRGRLARVSVGMGSWRTSLGVRLGDTEDVVASRYPRLRRQQHPYDPEGEYLIVRGPKRRVVFETDGDDRVTSFRGGRVPEVMYIEGCA